MAKESALKKSLFIFSFVLILLVFFSFIVSASQTMTDKMARRSMSIPDCLNGSIRYYSNVSSCLADAIPKSVADCSLLPLDLPDYDKVLARCHSDSIVFDSNSCELLSTDDLKQKCYCSCSSTLYFPSYYSSNNCYEPVDTLKEQCFSNLKKYNDNLKRQEFNEIVQTISTILFLLFVPILTIILFVILFYRKHKGKESNLLVKFAASIALAFTLIIFGIFSDTCHGVSDTGNIFIKFLIVAAILFFIISWIKLESLKHNKFKLIISCFPVLLYLVISIISLVFNNLDSSFFLRILSIILGAIPFFVFNFSINYLAFSKYQNGLMKMNNPVLRGLLIFVILLVCLFLSGFSMVILQGPCVIY